MLIISRKAGESFFIDDSVEVFVLDVGSEKVKIGIDAPRNVKIIRRELKDTEKVNKESMETANRVDFNALKEIMIDKK